MAATRVEKTTEQEPRKRPEKRKKFDFVRNAKTIFVGNLPKELDHKDLAGMFKNCGPVESARIRSVVPEKEKLPPKVALITKRMHPKVDSVNGYVVFESNENDQCIKKALAMNGQLFDGHHIRVDRAQRPKSKRETLTSRKKSIFVGNLRFDLRDDDLINYFSKVGSVDYVRLVRDRGTGLGKGFGFVAFHERASVKKALELNEALFKGRQIRVKKVEDEDKKKGKKSKQTPNEASQKDEEDSDGAEAEMDHDDDDDGQDGVEIEEEIDDEDDEPEEDDDEDDITHEEEDDNVDQKKVKYKVNSSANKKGKLGVKLINKKKNRSNFAKKVKRTKGKKKFGRRGKK